MLEERFPDLWLNDRKPIDSDLQRFLKYHWLKPPQASLLGMTEPSPPFVSSNTCLICAFCQGRMCAHYGLPLSDPTKKEVKNKIYANGITLSPSNGTWFGARCRNAPQAQELSPLAVELRQNGPLFRRDDYVRATLLVRNQGNDKWLNLCVGEERAQREVFSVRVPPIMDRHDFVCCHSLLDNYCLEFKWNGEKHVMVRFASRQAMEDLLREANVLPKHLTTQRSTRTLHEATAAANELLKDRLTNCEPQTTEWEEVVKSALAPFVLPPIEQGGFCLSLENLFVKEDHLLASLCAPAFSPFLSIRRLNLSRCALQSLPEAFYAETGPLASSLVVLDLSLNSICTFPTGLCNLRCLEELYFRANGARGPLPMEIGQLSALRILDISHNEIDGNLPPTISLCHDLRQLNVSHTRLRELPPELGLLQLEELYVVCTNFTFPPPILLNTDVHTILSYLRLFCAEPPKVLPSEFSKNISSMRDTTQLSDVTFRIRSNASSPGEQPKDFSAHKVILSQSPYFRNLFEQHATNKYKEENSSSTPSGVTVIELEEEPEIFEKVLCYFYGKSFKIATGPVITRLVEVHETYHMPLLVAKWRKHLASHTPGYDFQFWREEEEFRATIHKLLHAESYQDVLLHPILDDPTDDAQENEPEEQEIKPIAAHKCILAARSPHFRSMFATGMKEAKEKEVQVRGVKSSFLSKVLEYIYSDYLEIDPMEAIEMLKCCNALSLSRLESMCECVLSRHLDEDNAAGLLELSDRLGCLQLRKRCLYYAKHNFELLKRTLKEELDDYLPLELQEEIQKEANKEIEERDVQGMYELEKKKRIDFLENFFASTRRK